MEGWEMLQMVIKWIRTEFAADEEALARQLANNEISYRFLWLYFVPGALISLEDPVSKQQMAARVSRFIYEANFRSKSPITCPQRFRAMHQLVWRLVRRLSMRMEMILFIRI
jgi:hypothetical protein